MKLSHLLFLTAAAPCIVDAGEPPAAAPASNPRWRFGVSFAPMLNADANFSGLGGYNSPFLPQPLGGGQNYEYEDGYVRVDSSGNAGGATWNWGYDHASQYNPAGTGSIEQHITNSAANGQVAEENQAAPALELFTYLDMGKIADLSTGPLHWGFRGGLHYARFSIENAEATTSDLIRVTDRFDLGGAVAPLPPYQGTFGGPGPLLGDSPTRTTSVIANGAQVLGNRELDADLFTFNLGPYLEVPVSHSVSLLAEAGASLAIARGQYRHQSVTTLTGLGTQTTRGDDTRTTLLPGLYAGLGIVWQQSESFSIIGSARYQYLDSLDITAGSSKAELNFDGSAVLSVGALWSY